MNPDTQSSDPSRLRAPFVRRLSNLASSSALITGVVTLYLLLPFFNSGFSRQIEMFGTSIPQSRVLIVAALLYALALALFYLLEPAPREAKAAMCLRALAVLAHRPGSVWREGLPRDLHQALLNVLLKGFFAPLMVVWLVEHSFNLIRNLDLLQPYWMQPMAMIQILSSQDGFWLIMGTLLLVDIFFFTLGYLIELPRLRNEIRSVDPHWFGWLVALACYPPFNALTTQMFGWYSTEFPQFNGFPGVHIAANLALLTLMAGYAWASVSLCFKASNLTHRGIVAHGPYRWVRHPAYVSKNLAWWIGVGPALLASTNQDWDKPVLIIGSMLGWSTLYYFRAITEERHLCSVDGSYAAYCQQVRYRFIPGLI